MKLVKLLILFISILFAAHPLSASETGVGELEFNISPDTVDSQIGKPVQQSLRDGLSIWWYESVDPVSADFVYFKNNQVVMTSESLIDTQQSLDQYIQLYNLPEISVYKYKNPKGDVAQILVHIWSSQGFAVQTSGVTTVSPAVRRFTFSPTTSDNFFENLAPDLMGNQEVSVVEKAPKPQVSIAPLQTVKTPLSIYLMQPAFMVAITLIIILGILVLFLQRKRR